jgi:hypothetical protein
LKTKFSEINLCVLVDNLGTLAVKKILCGFGGDLRVLAVKLERTD